MDLSKLKGDGGPAPSKKKSDKPLLNTVEPSSVDMFCQGRGIMKEGQDYMAGPKAVIQENYLSEYFHRNAGVAGSVRTFRAVGNDPRDSVTVYSNDRFTKATLQSGTEVDPAGEARAKALKDIVKGKFDKCFEEHIEVKLDTSDIPATLREEFVLDMIAVLNKYHKASCLKKVLRFTKNFEANRHELLTASKNLEVNTHMPLSVVIK